MQTERHQIVVIGGGIIGLFIALILQESGVNVLLLESKTIGHGTSRGNAGHLATEQVYPVVDPSVLKKIPSMLLDELGPLRIDWRYLLSLAPWGLRLLANLRQRPFQHTHQQLVALNAAALPAWQELAKRWGIASLIKIQGSLLVAERAQTLESLAKQAEYLNSIGIACSRLNAAELQDMEPALAQTQIGALFYPQTGHVINLDALFDHLKTLFMDLGGSLRENFHVSNVQKASLNTIAIASHHEVLYADNVVLATGAYSKPLVKQLCNINVPLETERGYHLMLPQELNRLRIPVSSADRRFIMTPMEAGLRLAGTVEYAGLKSPPNMIRARNFVPLAAPMFKEKLNTDKSSEWMGYRPTMVDSLPVIDKQDNCYFAFGHQHLGLTLAAITAQLILAKYQARPTPIDCQAFSINRF